MAVDKRLEQGGFRKDSRRTVSFLLFQHLLAIFDSVCLDSYEVILFRCSFVLAFYGVLRVSEFAAPNARWVAPLAFAAFILFSNSACLRISRSGCPFPAFNMISCCLVAALMS